MMYNVAASPWAAYVPTTKPKPSIAPGLPFGKRTLQLPAERTTPDAAAPSAPIAVGPANYKWSQVIVAELIFTFVPTFVVLSVASVISAFSGYFGLAIGMCVTASGFAVGKVSGDPLNPTAFQILLNVMAFVCFNSECSAGLNNSPSLTFGTLKKCIAIRLIVERGVIIFQLWIQVLWVNVLYTNANVTCSTLAHLVDFMSSARGLLKLHQLRLHSCGHIDCSF